MLRKAGMKKGLISAALSDMSDNAGFRAPKTLMTYTAM
jgi:hypothetical protein